MWSKTELSNPKFLLKFFGIALLLFLAFFEMRFMAHSEESINHNASSLTFLLLSISIGLITCLLGWFGAIRSPIKFKFSNFYLLILAVVIALFIVQPVLLVLDKFPFEKIDATQSDIIPQIQTMLGWTLNGVFPYQPIVDWGYEMFPTYLPLTWMPFVIPEMISMDYRIFAIFIMILGLLTLFKNFHSNTIGILVGSVFLVLLIRRIAFQEDIILGYSIETLIAGFYLFFMSTWKRKSIWLLGLGILLCLLSRYALVVWLPVFFLFLWKKHSFKFSFKTGTVVLAGVLMIYVIPFISQDTQIYQKGMDHHFRAARNEWKGQPWQEDPSKPYSLYKGVGMANRFFEMQELPLDDRIKQLQKWHIVGLIMITTLFGAIVFFGFGNLADPVLFLVGSFKIYLAYFYHFIQIPYTYLFLLLLIVNIPIILKLCSPTADQ